MKELVLTGIKELWPEDEKNAIFLGPWCFAYNHKYKFWDQKKFTLAPSPWEKPQDILDASLYIDSLIDRIIPPLSDLMNNFHKTNYSSQFWKRYFIVWLVHWLGVCYDRYQRLNYLQQGIREKLTVKVLSNRAFSVKDFWDYIKKVTEEHYYNNLLMSEIIQFAQFDFLIPELLDMSKNFQQIKNTSNLGINKKFSNIRAFTKSAISSISSHLSSSIHLGTVYGISIIDKFYLEFLYDPFFLFNKENNNFITLKGERSYLINQTFEFNAKNSFEKVIEKILLQHIPEALLTIYVRERYYKPKIKIWIGNDIYKSEKDAYRIAEICEYGGQWISAQHGGGYGQWFSSPLGKIEYETSNGFITWGWKYKHIYNSNYYSLPSPMLSKLPKHREKKVQLVFVGTMHPAYHYRFHSALLPEQQLEYMDNKRKFLTSITEEIRSHIKYKPYVHDYGTDEIEFITQVLTNRQILKRVKLSRVMQKTRLVVIDYLSTSMLEAFAMNAPTILFWNPEHFVVCNETFPYFDRLRSAGILFDTPEDAASKVNEIWHDVQGWWNQKEVQETKNEFCYQFARSSRNWRKEWLDFLKTLK
ncbi:hypothetical protein JZK55_12460 [Dissulfurispira thermophila]|uniref:Transferase, LIC12162 family n=1 Tax=Dissulfurispira thermophila TaxID=2715679 RepID=A0A7G1H0R1_9BACT|nr:LIC12162 family protein [Dissulfurispira thermophila]BCB96324.1 hypothetical protein JZK55_12460 [Dissulfurispira thermophila]